MEHAAEAPQVEADAACEAVADVRLDAAHHRGAAAVGNDCDPALGAPVEDRRHVLLRLGQRDEIGRLRELAPERPDEIAVRLAVGMARTLVRVGRAEPLERRGRGDPRRPQLELIHLRRLDRVAGRHAELRFQQRCEPAELIRVEAAAFVSPAPELSPGHYLTG